MRHKLTLGGILIFVALNAAGVPLFLWTLWKVASLDYQNPGLGFPALFAACLTVSLLALRIPGVTSLVSVSDSFIFSAVLFFGPAPAALVGATDAFIGVRKNTPRFLSALSSLSLMTLSILAAGYLYQGALGFFWDGKGTPRPENVAAPLGLAALAHYLLNTSMVCYLTKLRYHRPFFQMWRQDYLWTAMSYFTGAAAAGLAYILIHQLGLVGFLVCLPILGVTYYSYRVYLGRVEAQIRALEKAARIQLQTIEALATAIDAKGQATPDHLKSVQAVSVGMAQLIGVDDDVLEAIRAAALLHDVGKLAVPDSILNKPGRLTAAERSKIETYPRIGAEILTGVDFPYDVRSLIRGHRERWDGGGFPDKLAGEAIPLGARIIGLVDTALTMLTSRPGRDRLSPEAMLAALQNEAGRGFDPKLVTLFCENFETLMEKTKALDLPERQGLAEISTIQREHAESQFTGEVAPSPLSDISAARREEQVLYDLARELSANLALSDALQVVMNRLRSLITFDTGAICMPAADGRSTVVYSDGVNAEVLRGHVLPTDDGLTGPVSEGEHARVNLDPRPDFAVVAPELVDRYRSAAKALLVAEGARIGAIALYDSRADHFTSEDQRILDLVAPQAAKGLGAASSFEESQVRALTDGLTGLHNKRFFHAQFAKELARCVAENRSLGLVVIDLDKFKPINDTYGHQAGDEVLRAAAKALRSFFRGTDQVCRTGGDEFIVLMPEARKGPVQLAVQRAQSGIDELKIPIAGGHIVQVGLSAGWAVYPDDGVTAEELTEVADKRMYADKAIRHEKMGVPAR